jgi:hypothetical protein
MNCVRLKGGPGRWFVEQDKDSAVPYHGFGIFRPESGTFCRETRSRGRRVWYPGDQGRIALQDAIFRSRIPPHLGSFRVSHSNLAGRKTVRF